MCEKSQSKKKDCETGENLWKILKLTVCTRAHLFCVNSRIVSQFMYYTVIAITMLCVVFQYYVNLHKSIIPIYVAS